MAQRPPVELLEKNKPRQARAKRTYEAILTAAAELLVEVGVERISTNLVAERAGITVPALYRYFPNKYAVLNALGSALIEKQNAVFQTWFEKYLGAGESGKLVENVDELLIETYHMTREQVGGIEVVHALRAVEPLRGVRLQHHRQVAGQFAQLIADQLQRPADEELQATARTTIGIGYALVEMALEDESVPTESLLRHGAQMIQLYWQKLLRAT